MLQSSHVNSDGLLVTEGTCDGISENMGVGPLVELGSDEGSKLVEGAGEIVGSLVS